MAKRSSKGKRKGKRSKKIRAGIMASNSLAGRGTWVSRAGVTFDGDRDMYAVLGYPRVLLVKDFRERYERGGVAGRLVECKPTDTWRGGAEIIEDENPDTETTFEAAFEDLNKRLSIWTLLRRLDIASGIGRYGVLLLGGPGETDTPLEKCKPEELAYLGVYAEDEAKIQTYETDRTNSRFGRPVFYTIQRTTPSGVTPVSMRVHYTRIIHVADGVLDDPIFGAPRLRRIWNLLDDLDKVTGGGAEAFWRRADQGTQFNLDPTMELGEEEEAELAQEVEDYIHKFQRTLLTRGVDVKSLGSDVANFESPARAVLEQICAAVGIPQRILMGSEQAKLAAEQDRVSYDRDIESRRGEYAEPMIVRPFVQRLIELGVLPEVKEFEVRWSQIRTKSDTEKADLAKSYAAINAQQGEVVVTTDEIRERALDLPPLTEEQKKALQPPEPEPAPVPAPEPPDPQKNLEGAPKRTVRKDVVRDKRGLITSVTEQEL